MRAFILIGCICTVVQAQFGSSRFQTSPFAQSGNAIGGSRFQNTNPPPQRSVQQSPKNNFGQQSGFGNQYQSQNQYEASPRSQSAGSCREKNERSPVSGSCDRYIECINGTAEEKLCPDGLRFNPNVNFNVYPCQYPTDVPCLERSSLQPPQPTEDCAHQFGYFKIGDARNCSSFRNCVNGVGYDFTCPEGLAFSSESYRCEWPDQVADCDVEAFLGFRCPNVPTTKELGEPAGYRFYRSDSNCQKYFICLEGRPRVLSCGGDAAFDELTSSCVSADEVSSCPQELRESAARSRELEQQRLAKELSLTPRPHATKRHF